MLTGMPSIPSSKQREELTAKAYMRGVVRRFDEVRASV